MTTTQRPSAAVCQNVIGYLEEERNKIFAVASALRLQLNPDPKDIDYNRYNEWLLCEVICDILGDSHIVKNAREDLNCEAAP